MISIANKAITIMGNQLFLSSVGAKKPNTYSKQPNVPNTHVSEYLKASFNFTADTIQRTTPLNMITALFIYTLVD